MARKRKTARGQLRKEEARGASGAAVSKEEIPGNGASEVTQASEIDTPAPVSVSPTVRRRFLPLRMGVGTSLAAVREAVNQIPGISEALLYADDVVTVFDAASGEQQ